MKKKMIMVVVLCVAVLMMSSVASAGFFDKFIGYFKTRGMAIAQPNCTDSDGGLNYGVKGTVIYNLNGDVVNDYCHANGNLIENYCGDTGILGGYPYDCSREGKICVDGACVANTTQPNCTDSDGGLDYFKKGTINGISEEGVAYSKEDYCPPIGDVNYGVLQEYGCTGNGISSVTGYKCPHGCNDGACVELSGSCSQAEYGKKRCIFYDELRGGPAHWLQTCKGLAWVNEKECPNGCEDGACINLSQQCVNKCGNGVCDENVCTGTNCPCAETSDDCPQDCAVNKDYCGDGVCGVNETCVLCENDCGFCGDYYEMPLAKGWNLVSPLTKKVSVNDVAECAFGEIYEWSPSKQTYLVTKKTLIGGKGYMVFADSDCKVKYSGTAYEINPKISKGVSLIGVAFETHLSKLETKNCKITGAQKVESSGKTMGEFKYVSVMPDENLSPGIGYWVICTSPITGKCNNAVKYECKAGNAVEQESSASHYYWYCEGKYDGKDSKQCSLKKPAGKCGKDAYECNLGIPVEQTKDSKYYTWYCDNEGVLSSKCKKKI